MLGLALGASIFSAVLVSLDALGVIGPLRPLAVLLPFTLLLVYPVAEAVVFFLLLAAIVLIGVITVILSALCPPGSVPVVACGCAIDGMKGLLARLKAGVSQAAVAQAA
jgi:hypothetical protein